MKFSFLNTLKSLVVLTAAVGLFVSCNKDVPAAVAIKPQTPAATQTIADLLNDPGFSLLKAAVTKAGLMATLSDQTTVYTVFAPDDAAFQRSGISSGVIAALPAEQLASILRYHIVGGQRISSAMIPTTFPNLQLPTQLVLAPPSAALPPGLRMSIFPSKRGTNAWANNIPLSGVDMQAVNGIVHKVAALVAPPTAFLWNRINTDPNLTYLKAAIMRADEATPSPGLVAALNNPAANLTVFAPNDFSMQQFLIGTIAQALIVGAHLPPANAQAAASALVTNYGTTIISNPASIPDAPIFPAGTGIGVRLAAVLTPTTVQGLVVYHILGVRAFSVNLPTTATAFTTLLNRGIANHPGVMLQATFGQTGVTAATVKGAANPTASNLQINPTPAPGGTSDQHYINGVLHVIDQVLRPQ